jgi:hypothetical protein
MESQYFDRFIVCGIALEQSLLALLGIWLALMVPYGGGFHPILTAYVLWGFISGLLLFSGKLFARIIAIPWHVIFSAYIIFKSSVGHTQNQSDRIIEVWAYYNLLAIAYLIGTLFIQLRKQRTPAAHL